MAIALTSKLAHDAELFSVLFCWLRHALQQVERRLEHLPRTHDITKALQGANQQLVSVKREKLKQDKLDDFIDLMQIELDNLHDSINQTYF
ncbi:MAG: putative alpha-E superfamily protein [Shewanella psychromarinicola]|jgi:uncharacterized alpha-E superfamily protein|uniref:alpha-E domain-containing protein n=1 Tax=Shewanella psychromarinicola TaxID=2487742 RepID=UPI003EEB61A0